ncbi:NADH:flavin oxidoreductase [Sphingobium sp. MI1205]|uniref:NADH:flavin oxidoreductase n=1 Tax=Sphingobium sp. MI1205 TaxID=407020 RepID=UPI0007701666|nr:FMN-binding oxidoreductase [Sphingobium sp. MI1205]
MMTNTSLYAALFTPFSSPNLELSNRIVMAPMTRTFSPGGVPGENVADYYRRRAEGGVGLIITEGTWIPHHSASNEEAAPRFYGEDALSGWREVVAAVHAAGAKIMPQLWHTGLTRCPQAEHIYDDIVEDLTVKSSPSGYVAPGEKVGEGIDEAEIEAIIAAYAQGAATAKALGFDGVELHGAHGYMIDQFFWHETNKRDDGWGGNLAARARFGAEIVRACREAVGTDFCIVLRFSQWKLADYDACLAQTPEELSRFLEPLVDAGVDIFHASERRFWKPVFEGSDLNLAAWTKKLTGKPVITVGSVGLDKEMRDSMAPTDTGVANIEQAAEMVARGEVDLVAVGRALLSDPEWANKVREGSIDAIVPFNPAVLADLT